MNSKLADLVERNNGYLITSVAKEEGISRQSVSNYVKANNLTKVSQGVYITKDTWPDELYILQLKNKEIIYSFETSLYLHGLMEREPTYTKVTVKYGYNAFHLKKKNILVHTSIPDIYNMGIENVETQFGNVVKAYDMERTICDIIKYKNYIDIQVFTYALKEYVKNKNKNINKLMHYAEKLKVEDTVRIYLEVLL